MARPLRIDVVGGWYHITARRHSRARLFLDDRDGAHFLELLEEVTERFRVEVHAYVLMANHYHLLIRTPEANASRAIQWLNQSYGMWWNRRHRCTGQVFGGRFKGILVEGGAWVQPLSLYMHFNPVAVKRLKMGKKEKAVESRGLTKASPEVIKARLGTLRSHRWSSYLAYAGYERAPKWLTTEEVLRRVAGGRDGYRELAEGRLKQGEQEDIWSKLRWGTVLGSERFGEEMRKRLKVNRETPGRRRTRERKAWEEVVGAVEKAKGERWDEFRDRHGDWGRDMVLAVARRCTGMTLRELGNRVGDMDYAAVSEAIRHLERRQMPRRDLREARKRVEQFLNLDCAEKPHVRHLLVRRLVRVGG